MSVTHNWQRKNVSSVWKDFNNSCIFLQLICCTTLKMRTKLATLLFPLGWNHTLEFKSRSLYLWKLSKKTESWPALSEVLEILKPQLQKLVVYFISFLTSPWWAHIVKKSHFYSNFWLRVSSHSLKKSHNRLIWWLLYFCHIPYQFLMVPTKKIEHNFNSTFYVEFTELGH